MGTVFFISLNLLTKTIIYNLKPYFSNFGKHFALSIAKPDNFFICSPL
jgi:hypothetical protein